MHAIAPAGATRNSWAKKCFYHRTQSPCPTARPLYICPTEKMRSVTLVMRKCTVWRSGDLVETPPRSPVTALAFDTSWKCSFKHDSYAGIAAACLCACVPRVRRRQGRRSPRVVEGRLYPFIARYRLEQQCEKSIYNTASWRNVRSFRQPSLAVWWPVY